MPPTENLDLYGLLAFVQSLHARASAGVFWGTRSHGNLAICTPGKQYRRRASQLAVIGALLDSHSDFMLYAPPIP